MNRERNEEIAQIVKEVKEVNGDAQDRRIMDPVEVRDVNQKQIHTLLAAITEQENVKIGIRLEGMSENGIETEVSVDVAIMMTDRRGENEAIEATYLMNDRVEKNVRDEKKNGNEAHPPLKRESQLLI